MRIDTARSRTSVIPPLLTASLSLTTATLLAFLISASPASARAHRDRLDLRVDMRDSAATVFAKPHRQHRPNPQLPIGGGYTSPVSSVSYELPQSTSYGRGDGTPDSTSTYSPSSAYKHSSQNAVPVSPLDTGTGTGVGTWTAPAITDTGSGTATDTDTGTGTSTGTTSILTSQPDTTSVAPDSTGSGTASTPPPGTAVTPVGGGGGGGGANLTGSTRSGKACVTIHGDSLITGGACGPNVSDGSLPCVAIPHAIFFPNTPNGNGNLNPLCGKTVTITKDGGTPVKAMITDSNTANPAQDCGLGFPYSFDSSNALWAAIGGDSGPLAQISFVIDAP